METRRGGFALGLVVLLLFAIGVAGAVGYQVVQVESQLSNQAREMNLALSVAEAGLRRFLAEHRGQPPDTTFYNILGGQAIVTTRKLAEKGNGEYLYLISSTGSYADLFYADAPATRTVHQHAILRVLPISRLGAVTDAGTGEFRVENDGMADGRDAATSGTCTGAALTDIVGLFTAGPINLRRGSKLEGNPRSVVLGSRQAVLDTLRARFDILTDPSYPVDLESTGNWATWMTGLPADSFPVVRVNGGLVAGQGEVGRGVLIVTDSLVLDDYFAWDGIILAGRLGLESNGNRNEFAVLGLLATGFASDRGNIIFKEGSVEYHSCNVMDAGMSLAHFEPVENTWWEEY